MKKLLLLSMAGAVSFGAFAQVSRTVQPSNIGAKARVAVEKAGLTEMPAHFKQSPKNHTAAKPAATAFYSETFDMGMPASWTVTGNPAGGGWKWTKDASTSQFHMDAIQSTTAANGWMIYDSDSIGTVFPTVTPLEGFLTSPAINCASHTSVQLKFESYFRKFNDSTFVEVSNDAGATWYQYSIAANNNLAVNASSANPETIILNISPVAAGFSNVMIRFHYKGTSAGGSYSWMIDDVALSELSPVQVELTGSGTLLPTGYGFGSIPKQLLVEPVMPYAFLSNNGGTDQDGLDVTVKIYDGDNLVFDKTVTAGDLPVAAEDSLVIWEDADAFTVADTGVFTAAFSVDAPGDDQPGNNVDTSYFVVTNDVYSVNSLTLEGLGGYWLHRPSSNTSGEMSLTWGTLFTMPAGAEDTLTAIRTYFVNGTTVGAKVIGQIYMYNGTSWDLVTTTKSKTLAANDISTSTTLKSATMDADYELNTVESYILSGGSNGAIYMATIQPDNVAPTNSMTVYATDAPGIEFTGLGGFVDTAFNNGESMMGSGSPDWFGPVDFAPMIELVFGDPNSVSIPNVNTAAVIGNAYPNPANNKVTIPVQVKEGGNVTVTVTNAVGQVMVNRDMGKVNAGFSNNLSVNTANFANGVYIYTVEVNGKRNTGRFVVSH